MIPDYVLSAMVIGLSIGFMPGPLTLFIIREVIRGGFGAGVKICLLPLVTDGPIILGAIGLVRYTRGFDVFLGAISVAGALFLVYIAYLMLRVRGISLEGHSDKIKSVRDGLILSFLNPSPYLLYTTVAGPYLVDTSIRNALIFILAFLSIFISCKIFISYLVSLSTKYLQKAWYTWLMRGLAAALLWFAAVLLRNGYRYLL